MSTFLLLSQFQIEDLKIFLIEYISIEKFQLNTFFYCVKKNKGHNHAVLHGFEGIDATKKTHSETVGVNERNYDREHLSLTLFQAQS